MFIFCLVAGKATDCPRYHLTTLCPTVSFWLFDTYVPPAEYASTLHNVLVGLESSSLALWKLVGLAGGYLGLLLFTVYLASSEVRLPIVQYAKAPPQVSNAVAMRCGFWAANGVCVGRTVLCTAT
jgi:hypothetical protein